MPSRRLFYGIVIAAIAAVALAARDRSAAATADGDGVLDQESAVATNVWARCLAAGAGMAQTFRPRSTPLSAVELDIRAVPPRGDSVRVRLRAGLPRGRVLAEARAFVTSDGWVRFAFDPAIGVELGSDYVIEWIGSGTWWACSEHDPYPRGYAFNCGAAILPWRDFNFRTYAPADHWRLIGWTDLKWIMAGPRDGDRAHRDASADQERGRIKSRVEGGRAR